MKQVITAAISSLIAVAALLFIAYKTSWIEEYGEAEPLHPIADEFASALKQQNKNQITLFDLRLLLTQERFKKLRKYGFILLKTTIHLQR